MDSEQINLRSIFNSVLPVISKNEENSNIAHRQSLIRAVMLIGSIHTLNTTMLFQAAVNQCNTGEATLFITPSPLTECPSPIHGMPRPSTLNMNFMTLVYVDDLQNLMKFLSTFHIQRISVPPLIVIDNLDYYIEQMKDHAQLEQRCARLCALLQETASFCAQKRQTRTGLFLGCKNTTSCVRLLNVFSHFFQTIWIINENIDMDNANNTSFVISQLYGENSKTEKILLYKHADTIFIESIHYLSSSGNFDVT